MSLGARHIRETGEWLVPSVNNEAFLRKPPLAFWIVAAASFITDSANEGPPVSESASRLPSAVAAILTVLLVRPMGRSTFGYETAAISGLVMAGCAGTFSPHNL